METRAQNAQKDVEFVKLVLTQLYVVVAKMVTTKMGIHAVNVMIHVLHALPQGQCDATIAQKDH